MADITFWNEILLFLHLIFMSASNSVCNMKPVLMKHTDEHTGH